MNNAEERTLVSIRTISALEPIEDTSFSSKAISEAWLAKQK